jgi:CBS domain-containing protein
MTPEPTSVRPDERLERAAHLMAERRIKHLPVVDDAGHLVGMVSRVDVLRTICEDYHAPDPPVRTTDRPVRVVGDLMRADVPSVTADASVGEVLDAVTSTRLNRAIVIDRDAHVLGIATDQDLLARLDCGGETSLMAALMRRGRLTPEPRPASRLVARDVIHGPVVAVPADTPVGEAAQRMLEARRKILPITDTDGRLVGVVDPICSQRSAARPGASRQHKTQVSVRRSMFTAQPMAPSGAVRSAWVRGSWRKR